MVVDLLDPLQHSSSPFFYFWSLHECQNKNDFLLWGVESCNVVVERQILFNFVHESVCFLPFPLKEGRIFAHGFDVGCCCNWLCRCSSHGGWASSSWWSASSWWFRWVSSGSSPSLPHC